jgi:hypothetical protein
MTDQLLRSILARLERLEQQALGADTMQPNVLTINPDGTIGINLSGHLVASGVDLPAGTNNTPPSQDRVRWLRSDGRVVGDLTSFEVNNGAQIFDELLLQAYALAGTPVITLTAGNASLVIGDPSEESVGSEVAVILNSSGASSFIQNMQRAIDDLQLQIATGTISVAAGWGGPYAVAFAPFFANTVFGAWYSLLPANNLSIDSSEISEISNEQLRINVNSQVAQDVEVVVLAIGN